VAGNQFPLMNNECEAKKIVAGQEHSQEFANRGTSKRSSGRASVGVWR